MLPHPGFLDVSFLLQPPSLPSPVMHRRPKTHLEPSSTTPVASTTSYSSSSSPSLEVRPALNDNDFFFPPGFTDVGVKGGGISPPQQDTATLQTHRSSGALSVERRPSATLTICRHTPNSKRHGSQVGRRTYGHPPPKHAAARERVVQRTAVAHPKQHRPSDRMAASP